MYDSAISVVFDSETDNLESYATLIEQELGVEVVHIIPVESEMSVTRLRWEMHVDLLDGTEQIGIAWGDFPPQHFMVQIGDTPIPSWLADEMLHRPDDYSDKHLEVVSWLLENPPLAQWYEPCMSGLAEYH